MCKFRERRTFQNILYACANYSLKQSSSIPRILSGILRPSCQYSSCCLKFFWKIPTHRHHFFRSAVDQSKKIGTVCIEHKPTRFLQAIYFISLTGWRNFTRKVYIVFGTDFSLQQIHRLLSYQGEFFLRNPCFLTKTMYREKKS